MGFTTPCFVRRNTPELRNRLERLGYIICPDKGEEGDYLFAVNGMFDYAYDEKTLAFLKFNYGYIDCGTNEELFLAIAAKQDCVNANQYWVCDKDFSHYKKNDFIMGSIPSCSCYFHVATTEELIEYFK